MACRGRKHFLMATVLILVAYATVAVHSIPTELRGVSYNTNKDEERINTSGQDIKEDASLFDLKSRSGYEGLEKSSGEGRFAEGDLSAGQPTGIVPKDAAVKQSALPLPYKRRSDDGELGGTGGTGINPDNEKTIVMHFPSIFQYRSEEGGLGGNSGPGIEPSIPFGSRSHFQVLPKSRSGKEGLGKNGGGIVPDLFQVRLSEKNMGGSGGIEPTPPFASGGNFQVHPSKRWGEGGLDGNSGNGIIPGIFEVRSEEDGLGSNIGWRIKPANPLGSRGNVQVNPSRRWEEEGLGGNSGNGIVPGRMEKRSEEGLGGNSGWGTEPLTPFGIRGNFKDLPSRRWGEEGLGGNSGNGIVPDSLEVRSEEDGLGSNIGWGIKHAIPFGSRSNSQGNPSRRWGDEGLAGNSGDGIEPERMEKRSEEGLGGNGGPGIEPSPPFQRIYKLQNLRGEEGLEGNSGNGIVPDRMERRSEEGLGGNGGPGIEPTPPFPSQYKLQIHRSNLRGEEGLEGHSGNGIVPDRMEVRSGE